MAAGVGMTLPFSSRSIPALATAPYGNDASRARVSRKPPDAQPGLWEELGYSSMAGSEMGGAFRPRPQP